MIHVRTLTIIACLSMLSPFGPYHHTNAITPDHLLWGVTATAAGYTLLNMHGQWLFNSLQKQYAPVRSCMPRSYVELVPRILKEHDQWLRSNRGSLLTNYPLIWYVDGLYAALDDLCYTQTFHFGASAKERNALLHDLEYLRQLVIADYSYIKERRAFDYYQKMCLQS